VVPFAVAFTTAVSSAKADGARSLPEAFSPRIPHIVLPGTAHRDDEELFFDISGRYTHRPIPWCVAVRFCSFNSSPFLSDIPRPGQAVTENCVPSDVCARPLVPPSAERSVKIVQFSGCDSCKRVAAKPGKANYLLLQGDTPALRSSSL